MAIQIELNARENVIFELAVAQECLMRACDGLPSLDGYTHQFAYSMKQIEHAECLLRRAKMQLVTWHQESLEIPE